MEKKTRQKNMDSSSISTRRGKKKKQNNMQTEKKTRQKNMYSSSSNDSKKPLTENRLLYSGLRVIQVHQQPFVQGLKVRAVQIHFVVILEAVKVGQEGVGHHHPHLVAAVVQTLQQIRVHVVQMVLVEGAAERVERACHDAAADEARALVVLVHGGSDLGDEFLCHWLQLQVNTTQVYMEERKIITWLVMHQISLEGQFKAREWCGVGE